MNRVYLILGGNMGNRAAMLEEAESLLAAQTGAIRSRSGLYETAAWGMENAAPFLNQVIEILTEKNVNDVLADCLRAEKILGRERTEEKYQARTIDIDILFYNDEIISAHELDVPHPRLHMRRFVLEPLNEIAPELIHPVFGKTINMLLGECQDTLTVSRR